MAHAWESWSDARAYDGTATILQPQALPLYDGIDVHTMVALFTEPAPPAAQDMVQSTWKSRMNGDFAQAWHDALANGLVPNTASPKANVSLRADAGSQKLPAPPDHPLTILFRPDPSLWDGRYANNAWLQELPRPLTKLTWDNPLLVAPAKARQLKLRNGDKVRLSVGQGGHDRADLDRAGSGSGLRRCAAGIWPAARGQSRRQRGIRFLSAHRP